jgi:hypothetical protein
MSLTKISRAESGLQSSSNIVGTLFSKAQLDPAAFFTISYTSRVFRPARAAKPIASAAAVICVPTRSWLIIFKLLADPIPPGIMKRSSDRHDRMLFAFASESILPDAKIVNVPSAARKVPPDTGQSINPRSGLPIEIKRSCTPWIYAAGSVEHRRIVAP